MLFKFATNVHFDSGVEGHRDRLSVFVPVSVTHPGKPWAERPYRICSLWPLKTRLGRNSTTHDPRGYNWLWSRVMWHFGHSWMWNGALRRYLCSAEASAFPSVNIYLVIRNRIVGAVLTFSLWARRRPPGRNAHRVEAIHRDQPRTLMVWGCF